MLLHGTTANVEEEIREHGLVEPFPHRGVAVTSSRWYAELAAQLAGVRARHDRGGDEREAVGLIVHVDVTNLGGLYTGVLDFAPSWSLTEVGPEFISRLERITVALPEPGSKAERGALRSGFGSREPGRYAEPTRSILATWAALRG